MTEMCFLVVMCQYMYMYDFHVLLLCGVSSIVVATLRNRDGFS